MDPIAIEFHNEIDKAGIEQLHAAVLQISETCYDIKKLCATILASSPAIIAAFAEVQVGPLLFFIGTAVTLLFWFLDAQNYFYQRKIRDRMRKLAADIAGRTGIKTDIEGIGMPMSGGKGRKASKLSAVVLSAFNPSMIFYYLLTVFFTAIGALQAVGIIPIITLIKP